MIRLNGHILLDLDLVDSLEDGEAVANTVEADLLELGMLDLDQDLARELVFCTAISMVESSQTQCSLPINASAYCFRPRRVTKSATFSLDQSVIRPVGVALPSREWEKVVGVCSVLMGPEEVGELSA